MNHKRRPFKPSIAMILTLYRLTMNGKDRECFPAFRTRYAVTERALLRHGLLEKISDHHYACRVSRAGFLVLRKQLRFSVEFQNLRFSVELHNEQKRFRGRS